MIWHAFAFLAASVAPPAPEPEHRGVLILDPPPRPDLDLYERGIESWQQDVIVLTDADRRDPRDLNRERSPNRTTSPTPRSRAWRWYNEWDIREHKGEGRTLHQYATQLKPVHRICRGRP